MPRRYFNWKLAIVLLIGVVVLAITAYGLRQWRRTGRSERGLIRGNKAYDERNYQEAATQFGNYLAVNQSDVPILLKYADAHLNIRPIKDNNVRQAITAYRTVLREDNNNSEAATKLTELYLGTGMAGDAEFVVKKFLETNQDLKLRRLFAMALADQRKYNEAVDVLKNIIAQYPDQVLAYETLGLLTEQRPKEYADPPDYWFNEAVKNNPSSALAYIIRADFNLRNKEKAKALADLKQAETMNLSESVVRLRLGIGFLNANVFDKAEIHFNAAKETDPENLILWQNWAQCALKSQSKEKMLMVAETGLKELSAQPWDFMPTAVELFIRSDNLENAADYISKLREKDIDPKTTEFLQGLLFERQARPSQAVECFRRAIQSGNKSPKVRLLLASAFSRTGNIQSALHELRVLVSQYPDFFDGRLALAKLLAGTRNWTQALEQARQARRISPNSLGAALLAIKAQMQILVENQTENDSPMWQDIERELAALEKAVDNALPVKSLQLQLAFFRSQYDRAQQLLSYMKNNFPSHLEVGMAEIELLIAQDRTEEAITKLYDVVGAFPESVSPVRYLTILLEDKGRTQECEKVLKDALAHTEQPVVKRQLGLFLAGFYKRWKEQVKLYQLLDSLNRDIPDEVPVIRELLRCEKVMENPDLSQQLVDKIKTIEGEQGWQWRYEQARIWFARDSFKDFYPQIITLLKENLLANPDDQMSRVLLASAYGRSGELQLAIATYEEALRHSPTDFRIIIPAVVTLNKAGETDRADRILQVAADQKLYHPDLKKLEVQSHLRRGEVDPAIDVLEDWLIEEPNNLDACLLLVELKTRKGNFVEAGQMLDMLKTQQPGSLPITEAQIEFFIAQGKSAEALLICDEIVKNLNNASAYIIRARTFFKLGKVDKAREDFERAVTIEPDNIEALLIKSDFYGSMRQLGKAIADMQRALSLDPDNLEVQKHAISLFLVSRNQDITRQGKSILDKALTVYPDDLDLRLYRTRYLLAEETAPAIDNAAKILRGIIKEQPEESQAWMLLGELLRRQGQLKEAMDIALQGLAHKENDRQLLLLKARIEKEHSPALAIPTLKQLHDMDPEDVDTALLLADVYVEAQESTKAVNLLREKLADSRSTPDKRKINIALFRALYKNGNKVDAQKILDSLYQSVPNDPAPLLAHVGLLKEDKLWDPINREIDSWSSKYPKDSRTIIIIAGDLAAAQDSRPKKIAEDLLRNLLERNPDSVPAMESLAMLLMAMDKYLEAATIYSRILKLQPDNVVVINNLAWILCEEQGEYRQALDLALRGLSIAPDYVDLIDTCGVIYYRLGQYDKAVQCFKKCVNLFPAWEPSAVGSYFYLGKALADLGQKTEAVKNLNKALELNAQMGTLSPQDVVETQRLVEQLSRGS
jgi:tetratricopeptide (TPR) repeat protein